jgi:hypothetical protein
VNSWFPGAGLIEDRSWGLVDPTVLQLRHHGQDVIVKAGGPDNHHIARELAAYEQFVSPLAGCGRSPRLLRADTDLRLLATTHLPGALVEGDLAEWRSDTYRQAGRLLAVLHGQDSRWDAGYEAREDARALAWLDRPHTIASATVDRLRAELGDTCPGSRRLVPTHGDWQPRNWLVDDRVVHVIDFGRADWRTAETDLARLAAKQLAGRPDLERAFLDGYGSDPREATSWRRVQLREAVATAVWAHSVGDRPFEQQGHRMLADLLGG